jgi:hypothetical protein
VRSNYYAPVKFFADTDLTTLVHWYIVPRSRKVLPEISFVAHEPWHDDNGPASGMEVGNPPWRQGTGYVRRFGGAPQTHGATSGYTGHYCGSSQQWQGDLQVGRPSDRGDDSCCGNTEVGALRLGGFSQAETLQTWHAGPGSLALGSYGSFVGPDRTLLGAVGFLMGSHAPLLVGRYVDGAGGLKLDGFSVITFVEGIASGAGMHLGEQSVWTVRTAGLPVGPLVMSGEGSVKSSGAITPSGSLRVGGLVVRGVGNTVLSGSTSLLIGASGSIRSPLGIATLGSLVLGGWSAIAAPAGVPLGSHLILGGDASFQTVYAPVVSQGAFVLGGTASMFSIWIPIPSE